MKKAITEARKSKSKKELRKYTPEELSIDMISIFGNKSIGDMDDEALTTCIRKLHEARNLRISATKKKSAFNFLVESIDITKARKYLEILENEGK
jgi:hypothetical protein